MYLTLEVVSPQAASLGPRRRQIVGAQGLTIGRAPENDWVIPDPYVSKQHARIVCSQGRFFVEGLGRNPIALGRADNAIPTSQLQPLDNGDRLFIDQYEILVAALPGDPPGLGTPGEDGLLPQEAPRPWKRWHRVCYAGSRRFGVAATPTPLGTAPGPAEAARIPDAWDRGIVDVSAETAELDPLQALGNRGSILRKQRITARQLAAVLAARGPLQAAGAPAGDFPAGDSLAGRSVAFADRSVASAGDSGQLGALHPGAAAGGSQAIWSRCTPPVPSPH